MKEDKSRFIKVKYIRAASSIYFDADKVYTARLSKDTSAVLGFFFTEDENDEAGWYAFPASWFERID